MKIRCKRGDFLEGVRVVQNALTSVTLPVLSHILMIAKEEGIKLVATNLETTIQSSFSGEIIEEGEICLPGNKIFEILRELPSQEVDLEIEDSRAIIKCGRSTFQLLALEASEFPEIPKLEEENIFLFPQDKLREMIQKTSFAASLDETRQGLNGIYLSIAEGEVRMVATDGRRLAFVRISKSLKIPEVKTIIPLRAIQQLMRILGQGEEVRTGIGKHQAFFNPRLKEGPLNQILLISQLIEAEFPDYENIIPKEYKVAIMVDRDTLFRAIKRVSLLSNEKSRLLKLKLKGNVLSITANTPEMGSSYEELTVKREGEEDIGIGFNATYLLDGLKNIAGEVRFELTDSLSPGVIKPVAGGDEDYVYVVMPIRIEEE